MKLCKTNLVPPYPVAWGTAAHLQRHLGSLDEIKGIVRVNGYVNAIPGFPETPKVINGASDLFIELLGESARHLRAVIVVLRCRAMHCLNSK